MIKIIQLTNKKYLTSMSEAKKYVAIIKKKECLFIKLLDDEVEVVDDKYIEYVLKSDSVKHLTMYIEP